MRIVNNTRFGFDIKCGYWAARVSFYIPETAMIIPLCFFFLCVCQSPPSSLLFFCLLTFIRERKKPPPVVFLSLIILSLLLLTYLLGRFSHYCLPSVKKKPVAVISRNSLFFSIFVFCFSLLDTAVIRGDSRSAFFFFFFF